MNCKKLYVNPPFSGAFLLESHTGVSLKNLLFFDIETTGLSWKNSMVFLIGFLKANPTGNNWLLEQWFLEDPSKEKELLEKFSEIMDAGEKPFLIHYNGQRFDLPYLENRCRFLEIPVTWKDCRQLDLYRTLRPYQNLMKLEHMRLPDLEAYLNIRRPKEISGKECTTAYKKYVMDKNPCRRESILLHNRLDLTGLLECTRALAYPALFFGRFQLGECLRKNDELACSLIPEFLPPCEFALDCSPRPWHIWGTPEQVKITFSLENGYLRMYYPNYKDYYYLPAEDMAVHKSVGTYVDKDCRRQATALNCYTRFLCSRDFLGNPEQVTDYIKNCLSVSL